MTTPCLSRLKNRIVSKLMADERRTKGGLSSSHPELVQALPHAKGNISYSVRRGYGHMRLCWLIPDRPEEQWG